MNVVEPFIWDREFSQWIDCMPLLFVFGIEDEISPSSHIQINTEPQVPSSDELLCCTDARVRENGEKCWAVEG